MKITLKNFKCWEHKELTFKDEGIILLSAKSGKGKSSILDAIHFCLFGNGTKLVMHSKTSCSVIIEVGGMVITRTRKPNHLSLSNEDGYYEDDVAQSIIDDYFGSLFDVVSYVKQDGINTFLRMTPTEKMEFLERAIFQHSSLKQLKIKSQSYIKDCNENLVSCVSKISTLRETIEHLPIPEKIDFPIKVKKDMYPKVEKNEQVKKKNCEILLKKNSAELIEYTKILNHFHLLKQSNLSKLENISKSNYQIQEAQEFLDNFKENFKGYEYFEELKDKIKKIESQKEIRDISKLLEEDNNLLDKLKEDEMTELKNKIQENKEKRWLEKTKEEVESEIDTNKDYFKDLTKLTQLKKEQEKYSNKGDEVEQIEKNLNKQKEILKDIEKEKESIEQSKNIFKCPHCENSISFSEGKVIKSEKMVMEDIYTSLEEIKIKESELQVQIKEKENKLKNYIKSTESYNRLQENIQTILDLYEGLEDFDYLEITNILKETEKEIKILEEYLKKNIKYDQEISVYESYLINEKFSNSVLTLMKKVKCNEEKLENLKKDIGGEELILDEDGLRKDFENQRNLKEKIMKLEDKIFTLKEVITNYEEDISSENRKFYQGNSLDESTTEEDIQNKIQEINLKKEELTLKLEETIKNISQIEKYNNYIQSKEVYEGMENKLQDSQIEEKEFRENLAGATMLKDKISEAESIAITNFVHSLNISVNLHLEFFFREDPMTIEIETFKEAKNSKQVNKPQIVIKIDYKGMECDISSLSGGERDRLDLAFTLALSEIFGSKMLMLDECISSLDYETSNHVLNGLRDNYKGKTVLVVSHQANEGSFDDIIKF
jgi:DNA repair exonuclease SbcCD ATPase subunit